MKAYRVKVTQEDGRESSSIHASYEEANEFAEDLWADGIDALKPHKIEVEGIDLFTQPRPIQSLTGAPGAWWLQVQCRLCRKARIETEKRRDGHTLIGATQEIKRKMELHAANVHGITS